MKCFNLKVPVFCIRNLDMLSTVPADIRSHYCACPSADRVQVEILETVTFRLFWIWRIWYHFCGSEDLSQKDLSKSCNKLSFKETGEISIQ